ncbi:MAG TPA: hypothetical protein VHV75_12630 [Solirubrobacteraceae bacterium]|jgi:hypothetical protein|nr:hypothetical protein [Solirubrobacteraceae bacterium]
MASARISSEVLGEAAADLLDRMLFRYIDWREEADTVTEAYQRWSRAEADTQRAAFSVYTAALDREQAAAARYALAVTGLERWLQGRPSCEARARS